MKKTNLAACLLGVILTSTAMASPCDGRTIHIVGPEYYQYTIKLSKGTIGKKGNKIKVIKDQLASPYGTDYDVFSGKGTRGNVAGEIYFSNLETKENLSLPVSLIAGRTICRIEPPLQNVEVGKTQIQARGTSNGNLAVKIREFR